jgi:hypothetical protein
VGRSKRVSDADMEFGANRVQDRTKARMPEAWGVPVAKQGSELPASDVITETSEIGAGEPIQKACGLIIEGGLLDCLKHYEKGEGPPGFYQGSIQAFDQCRKYSSIDAIEARIKQLRLLQTKAEHAIKDSPDDRQLKDYWYLTGYMLQLEYMLDKVILLRSNPNTSNIAAILDLHPHITPSFWF